MFAFLKRHWAKTDPLKWVSLFIFEFVVVLLGVMVAQSLQERFELRREEERFEATREVLNEQAVSAGTNLMIRGFQAICIRNNLAKIRNAALANTSEDLSDIMGHPPHPPVTLGVWSSEVARDARRFLDPDIVRHYDYFSTMAENVTVSRHSEEEWWATILLASGGVRRLSERERSDVVLASFKLDHAFEGWEKGPAYYAATLLRLGLEPDFDSIERIHSGEGICHEDVRAQLPEWREAMVEARIAIAEEMRRKEADK